MFSFLMSRRRFAFGAAAAATTALFTPAEAIGQAASSAASPQSQPVDQQAAAAMAKLTPTGRAEAEMKVAEIFRKYGERLSDEQKADIRKVMAETQTHDALEKMRAFALENGDQPATIFHAYRSEGNQ